MDTLETQVIEPEGIDVVLTVEQRKDGQWYVIFQGQEMALMSPIQTDMQYRLEWRQPIYQFSFAAARLER